MYWISWKKGIESLMRRLWIGFCVVDGSNYMSVEGDSGCRVEPSSWKHHGRRRYEGLAMPDLRRRLMCTRCNYTDIWTTRASSRLILKFYKTEKRAYL